jgi:hypothetical protein
MKRGRWSVPECASGVCERVSGEITSGEIERGAIASGEIVREERSPLTRREIDARHAPLREVRTQGLGIGIWELGF